MQKGFIKWDGGSCPVPEGTLVEVQHRNGEFYVGPADIGDDSADLDAGSAFWRKDNCDIDIIAYRVIPE